MSVPGWSLAWSEEFDGDAGSPPDPGTWRMETGNGGWGNGDLQYYTDSGENAFLDGGGNLAIVVRQPEPAVREDRYGGCGFTSARVISKGRDLAGKPGPLTDLPADHADRLHPALHGIRDWVTSWPVTRVGHRLQRPP
jgi:hypothetical protein